MRFVFGLGNPGRKYAATPHNVGFATVDELAARMGCKLRKRLWVKARTGEGSYAGGKVLLVEPETFMNRSGFAVSALMRRKGGDVSDMIVVVDDADLELGQVRVRAQGGTGGHNGLVSITECVGSKDFTRVRMGIGRDQHGGNLMNHVLSSFSAGQQEEVQRMVVGAADAVMSIIEFGEQVAMNEFN